MAFDQENDHEGKVVALLLEQYKGQPKMEGLIKSFASQIQELENAFFDMVAKRTLDGAEGTILDEMGTIVVQDRLGFDDAFYRNLLKAKVGENTSQGEIEKIIQITQLLTGADLVHLQEWYPAGIGLFFDRELDAALINFFYQRLNRVEVATVRLEALICFDPDEGFAFEGGPGNAAGFGDINNSATGGKIAELHVRTEPAFSFAPQAGVTDGDEGFGTFEDPLVGGILRGL